MTLRPVEWLVCAPLSGDTLAIVRAVQLGPRHETYFRAVTANPEPSQRTLIGYWATPQSAEAGVFGEYEHLSGRSLHGGATEPSFPRVPQKPPPAPVERGKASVPASHNTRR